MAGCPVFVHGSPCALCQVSQQAPLWLVSLQAPWTRSALPQPLLSPQAGSGEGSLERKDGMALAQGLGEVREGPSHPSFLPFENWFCPLKPFRTNLDTASCNHTCMASGVRKRKAFSIALLFSRFTQDLLVTRYHCIPRPPPPPQHKEPLPGPSTPSSTPTLPLSMSPCLPLPPLYRDQEQNSFVHNEPYFVLLPIP